MSEDNRVNGELTADKIAELKQRHGSELISVTAPDGTTQVYKKPSKVVWSDFIDGLTKEKTTRTACINRLVLSCVVMPSPQDASALFDNYPAFPAVISSKLGEMAGQSEDLDVKKL